MFSVDFRSLALLRIGLGLLLFFDTLDRLGGFKFHYTSEGFIEFHPPFGVFPFYSLHQLSGSPIFQGLLFGILLVASFALAVGFWSRTSVVICAVMTLSLQHHAPQLLYGGDGVTRILLLIAMFLPIGRRYSVDATLNRTQDDGAIENVASAALLAQVITIHLAAFWHKATSSEWLLGEGVRQSVRAFPTSLGQALLSIDVLLAPLNYLVMASQLLFPLMLLLSWRWRFAGALALIALHLGVGLFIEVGQFPWLMISSVLVFLPKQAFDWDWSASRVFPKTSPSLIATAATVGLVLPNLSESRLVTKPNMMTQTMTMFGLQQDWSMFVPLPQYVGWLSVRGKFPDGRIWDLHANTEFRGWRRPQSYKIPAYIRWGSLGHSLSLNPPALDRMPERVCEFWNGRENPAVSSVTVTMVSVNVNHLNSVPPKYFSYLESQRNCGNAQASHP